MPVALFDELSSGVLPASSPDLLRELGVTPAMAAGWTIVAMQLSGLLDAPLLTLAARWPRREVIAGAMAVVGLACAASAWAPSYGALLAALALYGMALSLAGSLSEATLVDLAGENRERMLGRWSLLGAVGDIAAPLLVGGLALVGAGWRAGMLCLAVIALAHAALIRAGPPLQTAPEEEDEPDPEGGSRAGSVRAAILWCCAGLLCAFLDEILVSFGALRLDELGAAPALRGAVLAAWVVGQIAGLTLVEWAWSRIHPLRLMLGCSLGCAAAFSGWLSVDSLPIGALLLGLSGLLAAPLFPIVTAQAYAALPGRSTTVGAISAVVSVAELALPFLIGAVADRWGLLAALSLLLAEPLGLFAVAAGVLWWRGVKRGAMFKAPGGPSEPARSPSGLAG